ncbi:MAG: hypothetical protein JXL97_16700 [Bacteroidales bacterium]|nr:hypothetical protein [Bacteroidales bacterium]
MKTTKNVLIISFLILLTSCERNQPNEISTELKAINDVFVELIEDTFYYHQFLPPPPPPPLNAKDSLNNIEYEKQVDKKYQEVKSDSFKIILAINDSLISTATHLENDWLKSYFSSDSIAQKYGYAFTSLVQGAKRNNFIDINLISKTGRFELKYKSGLKADEFWSSNPDVYGFIVFSRIYFNQNMDRAVFYFGHICAPLCGAGYIVKIYKENEIWKIDKKIGLWVS